MNLQAPLLKKEVNLCLAFTLEYMDSYQVKEKEAKNALVRRKFQMHSLVQMTLRWLNQHKERPVTQAKPVYRQENQHTRTT